MISEENEAMGRGSEIKAVATLLLGPKESHLPRVPGPIENAAHGAGSLPMISASFLQSLQSNTKVSKHTTLGHKLETPAHKVDHQGLYAPGLVSFF